MISILKETLAFVAVVAFAAVVITGAQKSTEHRLPSPCCDLAEAGR